MTDAAPPDVVRPAFAPGTIVADRYRIEARLGAGGGGTVFRCVDQQLGAVVALKIVITEGERDVGRWRREVAMARQITDRNVCRVHDLGEAGDLKYVTMELVEGTSLRSKIGAELPVLEARALIAQLVSGVAAIHAAGVVHRDLKPENVVVAGDGRAVIVDFGLAKTPGGARSAGASAITKSMRAAEPDGGGSQPAASPTGDASTVGSQPRETTEINAAITHFGLAVGTPRYMSPEQASGEAIDARTDVWALGLVIHELLTGTMPLLDVDGPTIGSAIDARVPGIGAIMQRCVALDPAGRFADARALRAALAPLVSPSPALDIAPPRSSRWPWLVAGIGAVAIAGLVIIATRGGSETTAPTTPAPGAVYKTLQVTTTPAAQWPDQSPVSVALDPTATRFAFTTGKGKLYVRGLAGGAPTEWAAPAIIVRDKPQALSRPRVVGWFADGSLAVVGSTSTAMWLVRARADGITDTLHEEPRRFRVAVSGDGKRIAIASDRSIVEAGTGKTLVTSSGRVIAVAWSPSGELAWIHVTGDQGTLETRAGVLWRGRMEPLVDPLLVFAGTRIAFSFRDRGRTSLAALDPATREVTVREQLAEHVGPGSAAAGVVLMVRGPARELVQIRDQFGTRAVRAHGEATRGTHLAGWTVGGRAVFREDDRVVAASPSDKAWRADRWPGTETADIPVAVIGDDVLVRREDGTAWRVDRVSATGERTPLGRFERATALHCIGSGCVIQQRDGADATWTQVDPTTGTLGPQIHRRQAGESTSFALSPDGTLLMLALDDKLLSFDRGKNSFAAIPPSPSIATRWRAIAFDDGGELWASAVPLDAYPASFVRFRHRGYVFGRPSALITKSDDVLRWFSDAAIAGSDRTARAAVATEELALEIWRADGI